MACPARPARRETIAERLRLTLLVFLIILLLVALAVGAYHIFLYLAWVVQTAA